jgi:hypothetical protein
VKCKNSQRLFKISITFTLKNWIKFSCLFLHAGWRAESFYFFLLGTTIGEVNDRPQQKKLSARHPARRTAIYIETPRKKTIEERIYNSLYCFRLITDITTLNNHRRHIQQNSTTSIPDIPTRQPPNHYSTNYYISNLLKKPRTRDIPQLRNTDQENLLRPHHNWVTTLRN